MYNLMRRGEILEPSRSNEEEKDAVARERLDHYDLIRIDEKVADNGLWRGR